jgi:hypothetical protein
MLKALTDSMADIDTILADPADGRKTRLNFNIKATDTE